jgi:ATP-dependent helicase HrpB
VLDEQACAAAPAEVVTLLERVAADDPFGLLGPREDVDALRLRLAFLRHWMPELDLPEPEQVARDAVAAVAADARAIRDVRRADVVAVMTGFLTHAQRTALETHAPTHWALPSGRRVPVSYAADRPPLVAARIQELFGLQASPRLAGGKVAVLFELLAPSARPMQVTDDLASFWRTTYAQVRAELRGRYPRHPWPEDPLRAEPTSRAKPRR